MDETSFPKYPNGGSLMLLNHEGKLKVLYVPFKVKCINRIGNFAMGTWLYVNQVSQDYEHLILYQVFNTWVPYHHFQIIINF